MDEHPEVIALLERHKDDQWFPHEPVGTHIEEGRSRLVDLVDDPPLIRNQQRRRGVMKQRGVPLALYPYGLPGGEDVCELPVELRQCRGESADSIEHLGKLLHQVGHKKRSTIADNMLALAPPYHDITATFGKKVRKLGMEKAISVRGNHS
jgi:hypothetical protein